MTSKNGKYCTPRLVGARRDRAGDLNLVTVAIVLWNTAYRERAIEAMQARGGPADSTLLPYLSPLGWEHINLTGDSAPHISNVGAL